MSYTRLLYHIIFRTKHGAPSINEQYEKELYRCIWKFTQAHHCILYRVNGMPDHIHLFVDIHQTLPVSEFVIVSEIKQKLLITLKSRNNIINRKILQTKLKHSFLKKK